MDRTQWLCCWNGSGMVLDGQVRWWHGENIDNVQAGRRHMDTQKHGRTVGRERHRGWPGDGQEHKGLRTGLT